MNETQLAADMRRPGYLAGAPKRGGADIERQPLDAGRKLHAAIEPKLRKSSLFGQQPPEPIEPAEGPRREAEPPLDRTVAARDTAKTSEPEPNSPRLRELNAAWSAYVAAQGDPCSACCANTSRTARSRTFGA